MRSDYHLGECCGKCGAVAEPEYCPACARRYLPGLHSRACSACKRLMCVGCMTKFGRAIMCAWCWLKKWEEVWPSSTKIESTKSSEGSKG